MSTKTKRLFACLVTGAMLMYAPGCDIENPSAVTVDSADPLLLIRGARSKFSDGMGIIGSAFVASDEGAAKTSFEFEDESGDISTAGAYDTWFSQIHQARRLSEFALDRADALGRDELAHLARVWHSWTLIRLAELWGPQPFDGGAQVPVEEMFSTAMDELTVATASSVDSTRHRAWAGVARIRWLHARTPVNQTELQAAIDAADEVLAEDPNFMWVEMLNFNPLRYAFGRSYGPNEFYRDIPLWFEGYPQFAGHDTTLTFNDQSKPEGVVIISATELRLIQAEAHLLLGDIGAAKTTFKAAPLLPINHVGVCREAKAPSSDSADLSACVDAMDGAALMGAIEDLRREDQYLSARRSVTDSGTPIMPFKLPENA